MREKICFIVPIIENAGGSIKVATWLANSLVDSKDVVIVSCTSASSSFFELDDRVRLEGLDLQATRVRHREAEAYGKLRAFFEKENFSCAIGVGVYETFFAIRACRKTSTKLIFWDHGALINQWDDKKMRLLRWLNSRFSELTIVLTERSKNDYIDRLHIPAFKVEQVPNPIYEKHLGRSSYDASSKRMVWIGRVCQEKGVDLLLRIAELFLPRNPEWSIDVYGPEAGDLPCSIGDAVSDARFEGRLNYCGCVNNVDELYSDYAMCMLTSRREGLPLVLLEAKAAKVPSTSFDITTGPSEIIADGTNGFLVEPFDVESYVDKISLFASCEQMRESFSKETQNDLGKYKESFIVETWQRLLGRVEKSI